MKLRLTQTTAPAKLPVDLNVTKQHLRLGDDDTFDDALLAGMVRAATTACEKYLNRALISQTWTAYLDYWPRGEGDDDYWEGWREGAETTLLTLQSAIELPKPPLQSVTHIKTYDDSDSETVYASSNYFVDTATEPGRVVLRTSAATPITTRTANGIEIQFVAGYGDDPGDVPEDIRQGIMMLAAHLYENRGEDPAQAAKQSGAQLMWQPYRIARL